MRVVQRIAGRLGGGLLIGALLLAACGPTTPAPQPEALVAPKQLATVALSPTPAETAVVPPTSTSRPTGTPLPRPTVTPTVTPYVGTFLGDGSAPLVMPTASAAALVDVTLIPPTPLGGNEGIPFASATPQSVLPGGTVIASVPVNCPTQPAAIFSGPYANNASVAAAIGCPAGDPESVSMAQQDFEQGRMFWTANGQIFALAGGTAWQVADNWQEGMPQDDPQMTVPDGLIQPIRGFGLAWRSNAAIRGALGWANGPEDGYTGTVQRFERGLMFTGQGGSVYALGSPDGTGRGQAYGPLF